MSIQNLRETVENIIFVATGRVVTPQHLEAAAGSLQAAGVNSIGFINIMETLETRYDFTIDPERDIPRLTSVNSIIELIQSALDRSNGAISVHDSAEDHDV
jgi:acyl carrier protein